MKPELNLIGLVVADMSRSLAFYRQLGIDVPSEADAEPHVDTVLSGGIRLAWDTIDTIHSFDPDWTAPTGGPRVSLAFDCDSPADVDTVYADMVEAGYEGHLEPWNAFWGMRYAILHDPDGNSVDLFAHLPSGG